MPASAQETIDTKTLIQELNSHQTLTVRYSGSHYSEWFELDGLESYAARGAKLSRERDTTPERFGLISGTCQSIDFLLNELAITDASGIEIPINMKQIYNINDREFSLRALLAAQQSISIPKSPSGLSGGSDSDDEDFIELPEKWEGATYPPSDRDT